MNTISVVLPAYNEVGSLRPLVDEIRVVCAELEQHAEIIIVDDGSTDGTWQVIQELSIIGPPVIRGIRLNRNHGKAAALSAGFDAVRGDIVCTLDADGQNDPADIPRLLDALDAGADVCFGRRVERDDPLEKRLPSGIQTHLAKLTGPQIHDFGCGMAMYRRCVIDDLDALYGDRHRYIAAEAQRLGYNVEERAINHRPRTEGQSKYGLERLLRGFVDLWYWVFRARWGDRPMHWLGGLGVVFMGTGFLIGAVSVIQKVAFGVQLAPRVPRLVLLSLLLIFGLQLFVFGFLAELVTRMEQRNKSPYRVRTTVGLPGDGLPQDAMRSVRGQKYHAAGDEPGDEIVQTH